MEQIHLDSTMFAAACAFIVILLAIIAVFLKRLLGHIDGMTAQIGELNETMQKIDKDLSGDVSILKERDAAMHQRLQELDPVWDRLRLVEQNIVALQSGCEHSRCKAQ